VVDHTMVAAVRVVSVQRGVDPAGLVLVAFGGAGPLHACALAEALGMPAVLVPPPGRRPLGRGHAGRPRQVDLVRSWPHPADHRGVEAAAAALGVAAAGSGGAVVEVAVDCRYAGQSHELTVPAIGAFAAEHARRNGFHDGGSLSRWWRCAPRPGGRRPSTSARWLPRTVRPFRRAGGDCGTGLHDMGCAGLAGPGCGLGFVAAHQSWLTVDPALCRC